MTANPTKPSASNAMLEGSGTGLTVAPPAEPAENTNEPPPTGLPLKCHDPGVSSRPAMVDFTVPLPVNTNPVSLCDEMVKLVPSEKLKAPAVQRGSIGPVNGSITKSVKVAGVPLVSGKKSPVELVTTAAVKSSASAAPRLVGVPPAPVKGMMVPPKPISPIINRAWLLEAANDVSVTMRAVASNLFLLYMFLELI